MCEKINDGLYKITPDCAEYKVFEKWITDEQINVVLALTSMKPAFVPFIAKKAKMSVARTREVLHEITKIGLVVQVIVPKVNLEIYLLPPYTPGIFEFLLSNKPFVEAHPEIAYAFHQHATTSQEEHAMNTPMGAGVMRVIPVESAIPADAQKIDNERCSKYIEDNEGHLNLAPCQCRRVRRMMGEGAGDLDEDYCLFMGRIADLFTHNGWGRPVSVDEAKALIKKTDDIGCVHQITTLHTGETFAICNCQVESCLALGVTQYFNTPNFTKSNYVAEIDEEKCVACGRCTDHCANNAIQMGQKLCAKEPIVHKFHELPDDQEWGPDKWNPNHRSNREYISPEGTAPCKVACPAHIAVQGYIKLASEGRYLEALELIKKENPLPAVCGAICNRKCEEACSRGDIDSPVAIDEIKKFIAAQELDRAKRFVPRRPYDYSDKRLGVIFKCGVEVGKDVTLKQLREQGYDAFYLGVGAQQSAKLGVKGEDLKGVWGGIDFLREVNAGHELDLGKKVVVVGGGNVAMDVARAAARLGVEVTVAYRRKEKDMPADPAEVAEAKEEGVKFLFEYKPVEIKGARGKVKALVCEKGEIECDAILAAIGQRIDLGKLDLGDLQVDEKGRVLADEVTYQTAQPDVFVGGDAHTGPKFAIDAIAQGKQAAISIHRYVHPGQSLTIGRDRLTYRAFDKDNVDFDTVKKGMGKSKRQVPKKDKAKAMTFMDDRKVFTEDQIKKEASRCLKCGASWVDPNKCLGCGVCTTRCKFDAIHLKKLTYNESIPYETRAKVFPEYKEARRKRIEIRKNIERNQQAK